MNAWQIQLKNGKWVTCKPLVAAMWANLGLPVRLV